MNFWHDGWSWDDVAGLITINASFFDKKYTIAGTSQVESWDITSVEFDNDVCRPKGIAYCLKRAFQQKEKYNLLKLPIDMKVILQNGSQSGISKYDGMMTIAYRTGNQSTWKIDYGNKHMFENFLGYINKIPITVNKLN